MNARLGYENGGLTMQSWIGRDGPQVAPNSVSAMSGSAKDVSPGFALWIVLRAATFLMLTWCRSHFLLIMNPTTICAHATVISIMKGL
jgi:hypothetical protein